MATQLPTFVEDAFASDTPLTLVLQDGTSLFAGVTTYTDDSVTVLPWDLATDRLDWTGRPRRVTAPEIRSAFWLGPPDYVLTPPPTPRRRPFARFTRHH